MEVDFNVNSLAVSYVLLSRDTETTEVCAITRKCLNARREVDDFSQVATIVVN